MVHKWLLDDCRARLAVTLCLLVTVTGCGVTSVDCDPAWKSLAVSRRPSLPLTISAGRTSFFVNGQLSPEDNNADSIFIEHARAARLFKDVSARQQGDLQVDEVVN